MTTRSDSLDIRLELSGFSSDLLQVNRLSGREAISQLFTFEVEVACPSDAGVDGQTFHGRERRDRLRAGRGRAAAASTG